MKKKRQWLWEFSKRIVILIAIAFFIDLIYSRIFLIFNPDSTTITELFSQMSSLFKVTVISYAVKAGFENVTKIKKYDKEEEDEVDN